MHLWRHLKDLSQPGWKTPKLGGYDKHRSAPTFCVGAFLFLRGQESHYSLALWLAAFSKPSVLNPLRSFRHGRAPVASLPTHPPFESYPKRNSDGRNRPNIHCCGGRIRTCDLEVMHTATIFIARAHKALYASVCGLDYPLF